MNEITHTPGPWRVTPFKVAEGTIYHILNESGIVLFGNYHTGYPTDTDLKGNAQLAAAAPELLAALKDIVHDADRDYKKAEHLGDKIGMLNAKHMRVIAWRAIRKVEPDFL